MRRIVPHYRAAAPGTGHVSSGGVIVLGVTERKDDGSFIVHGIPKAGKVLDDFWNAVLSEDKVSARFMKDADATVETVDGKDIVVIRVPWVDRYTRPVYVGGDLFGGTFRRTHTGDHQCKREEVLSMLRDSDTSSQDSKVVDVARMEDLDYGTVERYATSSAPSYEVAYGPDRTTLTLPLVSAEKKSAEIGRNRHKRERIGKRCHPGLSRRKGRREAD